MSDDKKDFDPEGWLDADNIELDPNGPKLEVSGPVMPAEDPEKKVHVAFMKKQRHIHSDMVACDMAKRLGWTDEQLNVLIEIRNGMGHWC